MTEQQDFLEHLKDPTKGHIKQAAKDFLEAHKNSIVNVLVTESGPMPGEYMASMVAENHGVLFATKDIFINHYLKKNLPDLFINISTVEERGGVFLRHYNMRMP